MSRPLMTPADRGDVFRGLAHPLRRRVIRRLQSGEAGVGELITLLKVKPQVLSRHLAVLREAGLVRQRLVGRRRLYKLNVRKIDQAKNWFAA